ncbi:hypothetical protein C8Q72DRAFT_798167 [Fomitopsis betulina]|nr:hypothetical protein C8Q72DRAFT_798167 [Fomitopsis betulina]
MPPSNLLTIYSLFQAHCTSAVANPARSDIFLRIPRRGIRSKKEIKRFVQGEGVIRSECWLAECVVAHRKSGLFTVRFSGKYLPLDATMVRTLAFIFLCFRRPVGAKPTWTPWPRWRLDRQPPEVLPANTLCNPLAVVAQPRHSNLILSLMQSSLTRHTIGPRIMSSEEDDYPLDAPSPRPLFDDGSNQGSDPFTPSSPPTEGGGTLSSINPTQCISERSITPSDFEGSADEDDDLELLVEHIKSWSLSRDVFGRPGHQRSMRCSRCSSATVSRSKTVAAQQVVKDSKSEEDGNEDGDFMSWKDIEVTMLPDRAGPSGSQDVSERPVGGTLPTTSALLPLASSAPASPAPASSAPASSAPASSIQQLQRHEYLTVNLRLCWICDVWLVFDVLYY